MTLEMYNERDAALEKDWRVWCGKEDEDDIEINLVDRATGDRICTLAFIGACDGELHVCGEARAALERHGYDPAPLKFDEEGAILVSTE